MQTLGAFSGGAGYGDAYGINNSGQVVGASSIDTPELWFRAFLWSSGSGMQNLGTLPGYTIASGATAINDSGQAVGWSCGETLCRAFLWSAGSGMQDLGVPPGRAYSEAYGINNSGQVTGHHYPADFSESRIFLWSSGSGMEDLGVPPGATYALAWDINDRGEIVGESDVGGFMWSNGTWTMLSDIPEAQAAGLASVDGATAINNAGQIVAYGEIDINNGEFTAQVAIFLSPGPSAKTAACSEAGQGGGAGRPQACVVGNPINPLTGNKFLVERDYMGAGVYPLLFERHYNSNTGLGSSRIGAKWRHTYDRSIVGSATKATVFKSDGKQYVFNLVDGNWIADADVMDRLVQTGTGWNYVSASSDEVETYDSNGRLISIANRAGVSHAMGYDASGRLASITHSVSGSTLVFTYSATGRIGSMTDPAEKTFNYAYDGSGNLSTVTFPDDTPTATDNPVRTYVYNEPSNTSGANLRNHLTGVIDEKGNRFATYVYGTDGRALSTEHANGVHRYSVAYGTAGSTTVTDPLNKTRTFGSQTLLGVPKNTSVDQPCDGCRLASATTYDASGYLSGATDFNGVISTYTHDARGLETSRVEASGTPQARTITTAWDATLRLPTQLAEPLRITTNVYDPDGTQCGARGALCSRSIQPTTDADGSLGFSATPNGTPRAWNYTYNSSGDVLTVNGPRADVTDVTAYTYYANNASCPTANGGHATGCRSQLETVANALSHTTSVTAYNAHGQPVTIVDPNGLTTTLTYDARQRLKTRTVGGELTTYDYDLAGQLTKVTLPDGSYLTYDYDNAQRLTEIADNVGNRIVYTLDAMGNRTLEEVRDPANALAQIRSRVYNNLNRLLQQLGASSQTIEFAYDDQGNMVTVKDPLNRITSNQYDALNRVKQVTSPTPISAVTQYGYDGIDQLISVTDPRSLVTGYTMNGLGDLTQQASPDAGTMAKTYDAAGNVLTQTDAKSQTTTYVYDALNRVTSITFHDGSKQTYTYDSGTNGIGRLTGISELDPSLTVIAQISYGYDQKGRMTSEARTINAVAYTTSYRYDSSGRLDRITYPSGRTVDYSFDSRGRISDVNTTPSGGSAQGIASSVTYHPFGGVKGFTFANSQTYARTYDQDGRIATYTLGGTAYTVGYDAASRIEFITETASPPNTNTYGYDNLDRLTSATLPATVYGYTYDAVGNRLTRSAGGTETYAYSSTSNRISSITPASGPVRNFTLDNNGSATADGNNTYTYDVRGRLVQAVSTLGTTTYQVNALGQRIRKSNSLGDRVFHYDTQGHLIAESTAAGVTLREYVWLGDMPIAVVDGSTRYYIHMDHLNTPRLVSNQTPQTVWRWDQQEPFGVSAPDENPSGVGAFEFPLRFPGQYADKETNLHYNYFRDCYDPATGRYCQSDPIGLLGGLNTYVYVSSKPIAAMDRLGLYESSPWLQALVPGQVSWDNAVSSWQNGSYGSASAYASAMVAEQILFIVTLGQSNTARIGAHCLTQSATRAQPARSGADKLRDITKAIEEEFAKARPQSADDALKAITNAAEKARLEPALKVTPQAGGYELLNAGNVMTFISKTGEVVIYKGSEVILHLPR